MSQQSTCSAQLSSHLKMLWQLVHFIYPCCWITGLFSLKMKYDESDNIFVRATRVVTDKVGDIFSKSDTDLLLIELYY